MKIQRLWGTVLISHGTDWEYGQNKLSWSWHRTVSTEAPWNDILVPAVARRFSRCHRFQRCRTQQTWCKTRFSTENIGPKMPHKVLRTPYRTPYSLRCFFTKVNNNRSRRFVGHCLFNLTNGCYKQLPANGVFSAAQTPHCKQHTNAGFSFFRFSSSIDILFLDSSLHLNLFPLYLLSSSANFVSRFLTRLRPSNCSTTERFILYTVSITRDISFRWSACQLRNNSIISRCVTTSKTTTSTAPAVSQIHISFAHL